MKIKGKINKLLSVMLVICMAVSALSVSAFAAGKAEGRVSSGSSGEPCTHGETSFDADKVALVCECGQSFPVVASVSVDGNTSYYEDLNSALAAAASGNGAVLTMLADITGIAVTAPIMIGEAGSVFTIDLNGHTISGANPNNAFFKLTEDANVTITDSSSGGMIEATSGWAIQTDTGKLTVAGGTVKGADHGIYVASDAATVTVSGGRIEAKTAVTSMGALTVTGGEIVGDSIGLYISGGRCSLNGSPVISGTEGSLFLTENRIIRVENTLSGSYTVKYGKLIYADSPGPVLFAEMGTGASAEAKAACFTPADDMDGHLVAVPYTADGANALALKYCKHESITWGKCDGCGLEYVADVIVNDSTVSYLTLEAAAEAVNGADSSIMILLKDAVGDITLSKQVVFNGGKFTLNGSITFSGEGVVSALQDITIIDATPVTVDGAVLSIQQSVDLQGSTADIALVGGGTIWYPRSTAPSDTYTLTKDTLPGIGESVFVGTVSSSVEASSVFAPADGPYVITEEANSTYLSHIVKSVEITMNGSVVSNNTVSYNSYPAIVVVTDYKGDRVDGTNISVQWKDGEGVSTGGVSPYNAGTYTYKVTGMNGTEYEGFSNEGTLTIEKAGVTNIGWGGYNGDKTYDGEPADTPTVTFSYPDAQPNTYSYGTIFWQAEGSGEWVSVSEKGMPADAGTYTVKAVFDGNENISGAYATKALTIAPTAPAVSWEDQTLNYSGSPANIEPPTVKDVEGTEITCDNISYSYTGDSSGSGLPTDAGSYTVTASIPAQGNYTAAGISAKLTIQPLSVTAAVTVAEGEYVYNGGEHKPAVTVKTGDEVIPDTEYTVSYSGNVNAGTATVTVTDAEGGNLTVSGSATFTVAPAKVTVTAENKSAAIYSKAPALTYTVSGLLGGDKLTKEPTVAYASTPNMSRSGTTEITVSGADAGGNYTIEYVKGKLSVYVPATQVSVDMSGIILNGKLYDGKALSFTGEAKGDYNVLFSYNWLDAYGNRVDAPVNAGTYRLRANVVSSGYTGYGEKTVTIAKAQISVLADDLSAEIGEELPKLSYTVNGLAEGDELKTEPTISCDGDMSAAGEYEITVEGAKVPDTKNYESEIRYIGGILTISDPAAEEEDPTEASEVLPVVTEEPDDADEDAENGEGEENNAPADPSEGEDASSDGEGGEGKEKSFPWWILLIIAAVAAVVGYISFRKRKIV